MLFDRKKPEPDTMQKLTVLAQIGRVLNHEGVVWAVGASLLLYLNGLVEDFHDIDLMTTQADAPRVKKLLKRMGRLAPPNPNPQYQTAHFYEFTIDGVEIDVMAGFCIVSQGVVIDRSLTLESITSRAMVGDVPIPLQSLSEWRKNYVLMGRTQKVQIIDMANRSADHDSI